MSARVTYRCAACPTGESITTRRGAPTCTTCGSAMASASRSAAPRAPIIPTGLRVVREPSTVEPGRLMSPADTYRLIRPLVMGEMVEHFYCIVLDSQSNVRHVILVTKGILNSTLVHPREVFRPAIVAGAASIVVAHNHPSGDPTPSADDRAVTRQLVEAGRILDIKVLDHVVIGEGRYTSFAEQGLL